MGRLTFDIVKGSGAKKFLDKGKVFRIRYQSGKKEKRIDIEAKDLKHTKGLYDALIKKSDPNNPAYENKLLRIIVYELWEQVKELSLNLGLAKVDTNVLETKYKLLESRINKLESEKDDSSK